MASFFGYALWLALMVAGAARADINVRDDTGLPVKLATPAQRIVSLAPHVTELLFAAGAGPRVVGVMDGSDYPPEAARLPRVGNASSLDLEAILRLNPDLVVAWASGNPPAQIARLRALGIPVFASEPRAVDDIATSLERLGQLGGSQAQAQVAATAYRNRLAALRAKQEKSAVVRAFYQTWHAPLMTVGGTHIISDAMKVCHAENVFASLTALAPAVSREAVVAANPELMVSSPATPWDWRAEWQSIRHLTASVRNNFCEVKADWLSRAGPRLLDGIEALCACVDQARGKRVISALPTIPQ